VEVSPFGIGYILALVSRKVACSWHSMGRYGKGAGLAGGPVERCYEATSTQRKSPSCRHPALSVAECDARAVATGHTNDAPKSAGVGPSAIGTKAPFIIAGDDIHAPPHRVSRTSPPFRHSGHSPQTRRSDARSVGQSS
jgi:hypothetical protein